MAIKKGLFKTSIGRKNLMAITGLFISFFLVIHLIGNLLLIIPESYFPIAFWGDVASSHDMYNAYSHFLVHFWPITVVAWVLYASILIHVIDALLITMNNWKTKGDSYVVKNNATSSWISRNMGILGSLLGLFILVHMGHFWLPYKILGTEHDLQELVFRSFKQLWFVILYEVGIIVLALHLIHGMQSAFRSLGVYQNKTLGIVKIFGLSFAIIMAVLYAIIPIILYLK